MKYFAGIDLGGMSAKAAIMPRLEARAVSCTLREKAKMLGEL